MGYDYYILVQGKKNGLWVNVDHVHNTGAYSNINNHYFMSEANHLPRYNGENFSVNMGEYQYIFSLEKMKEDHDEIPLLDCDTVKEHILWLLKSPTKESLQEIRDYIDEKLSDEEKYCEGYLDELTTYRQKCTDVLLDYDEARVVFGVVY